MSESMGFGGGLASSPSHGTRCGRGKARVTAHDLLLFALGILVFTALVCDSRQYHGVDVLGQPIYPEILDKGPPGGDAVTTSDSIPEVDTCLCTASCR